MARELSINFIRHRVEAGSLGLFMLSLAARMELRARLAKWLAEEAIFLALRLPAGLTGQAPFSNWFQYREENGAFGPSIRSRGSRMPVSPMAAYFSIRWVTCTEQP